MKWSDIAGVVGKAAPVVGTLLGGPAGAAVGSLISAALGTSNDPDAVSSALLANPDALVKLKELEENSKVQLQQLSVTAEQNRLQAATAQYAAEAGDRDSARKLAAAQPNDWVRPSITFGLLAGAIAMVVFVFSGMADGLLRDTTASLTVGTLIGYWFNELKQTLAFWFGMTRDGMTQNRTITDFATSPGSVTAAPSASTTTISTPAAVTVAPQDDIYKGH
ncbi:hypothetical protein ACQUFY_06740 [Robbsia andropogonis]|uniref:hypothetical protein n=1 Tax=Robbsia andropogonis TaxID=28092 RepID=UPI003D247861